MQNLEAIKADTHGAIEWVYPKDEADKVIADLKKEKEYVIDNMAEVINATEGANREWAAPEERQGKVPDCLGSQYSHQLINKEPCFSVLQFKDTLFNKYY